MSTISLVKLHTKMENHVSESFYSCLTLTSYGVCTLTYSDTYADTDADTDSCTEKVTMDVNRIGVKWVQNPSVLA